MKILVSTFLFVMSSVVLTAQGLDWQYSLRTPVESPTRFLGLQLAAGPALHSGELPYLQSDLGIECCRYTSGDGISFSGELMGEFWLNGSVAVAASVGYLQRGSNWVTDGDTLPRRDGSVVITEYDFDNSLRYATFGGTARMRVGRTNLTFGIGLRMGILLGTASTHVERVVSPDSYTFPTNPPSKEVVLSSAPVEDANSIVFIPSLRAAWDVSIGRGMYVTPFVGIQLPLTTVASSADWRVTELSLGLAFMRSF